MDGLEEALLADGRPELFNADLAVAVHERGLDGDPPARGYRHPHGWTWAGIGQYFCRAVVAPRQERGHRPHRLLALALQYARMR